MQLHVIKDKKSRSRAFEPNCVARTLLKLDLYGQPVGVNMDGDHMIRTWPGACCSVLTFLFILFFILNRVLVMTSFSQYTSATLQQQIDLTDVSTAIDFGAASQPFEIAAGFLDKTDQLRQRILQPPKRYGQFEFQLLSRAESSKTGQEPVIPTPKALRACDST